VVDALDVKGGGRHAARGLSSFASAGNVADRYWLSFAADIGGDGLFNAEDAEVAEERRLGTILRISGGSPIPTPTATLPGPPTATPPPVAPTCAPMPELCRTPAVGAKAKILIKVNATDASKNVLLWKWLKGAATTKAEFGDPVNSHTYELCIYGGSGLVGSATAPAGSPWKETGSGFKYKDSSLASDGLQKMSLKEGADEKAKIIVKGKGGGLNLPTLASLTSPLTVQLKRSGGSVCWGAVFSFPPAIKNDGAQFKDTAD
jgi:hypothetical protein